MKRKRKRKRLIFSILTALLAIGLLAETAVAADRTTVSLQFLPITYYFGDESYAPPEDQQGFLYKNRIYLPLRFVAHSLNQAVSWDSASLTATIRTPTRREQASIDTYNEENRNRAKQLAAEHGSRPVQRPFSTTFLKVTFDFYGEKVETPDGSEAIMFNNRLFVPLRFLATAMGYPVRWNQAEQSVTVETAPMIGPVLPSEEDKKPAEPTEPEHHDANADPDHENPPAGGIPGGGGFPSAPVQKPTYDELTSRAEEQLFALMAKCESRMHELLDRYDPSLDNATLDELKRQGRAELAACDAEFESIMRDLAGKLDGNGYPTDVVDWYRELYENIKAEARKSIGLSSF